MFPFGGGNCRPTERPSSPPTLSPSAAPTIYQTKIVPNDGAAKDKFGYSVAISDDFLVVGAANATGNEQNSGVVYLYQNISGVWIEHSKLFAADGEADENFGYSVGISGGNLIVGALRDKSAYIFEYHEDSDAWLQAAKLTVKRDHDYFGISVGISGDTAVVGAPSKYTYLSSLGGENDVVYVFKRNSAGCWPQIDELTADEGGNGDYFGWSVAISGNNIVVGAYADSKKADWSGAAYIFEKVESDKWEEKKRLTPEGASANDQFGYSVSISGNVIVVGCYADSIGRKKRQGSAYVFEPNESGNWTKSEKLIASDGEPWGMFGYSVNTSGSGEKIIVGAYGNGGSAHAFEKDSSGAWVRKGKLVHISMSENDKFGYSVAISRNTAVVGSINDGGGDGENVGVVYVGEV